MIDSTEEDNTVYQSLKKGPALPAQAEPGLYYLTDCHSPTWGTKSSKW